MRINFGARRPWAVTFFAIFVLSSIEWSPVTAADSGPVQANGFNVLSTTWGTTSGVISVGPGSQYVPLTVWLQYYFANTATNIQLILILPTGFTDANGASTAVAFVAGTITSGSTVTATFYLNVSPGVPVGSYQFPLTIGWGAEVSQQQSVAIVQNAYAMVYLRGKAQLVFQTPQASLVSGQVNNILITLRNIGSGPATSITATATATSTTVSVLSQFPNVPTLLPGENFSAMMKVFIPSSTTVYSVGIGFSGSYTDSNGDDGAISQMVGLVASAAAAPTLSFQALDDALIPGQKNTIPIELTNLGSGSALGIHTQISSSSQSGILSQFPLVGKLEPGSSVTANITIYAPTASAGTSLTFSVSSSFTDAYGNPGTSSQTLAMYVKSSAGTSLSVTTIRNSVVTGTASKASFLLKNMGNSAIYSPTFLISVPQPLVVSGNSTFSAVGISLAPGQTLEFTADLTASPSSTPGIYQGTLQVGFENRDGSAQTISFSVAVMLSGSVVLAIQDEHFSQNATALTVTGNILNEGSSPAYYSTVRGNVNSSKAESTPDYVGEVDVNSPVPFSVTIPYQAKGTRAVGNVTIIVQFKDSLGQTLNSSSSQYEQLKPLSELVQPAGGTKPTSGSGLNSIELTIIITAALVVAGTGGMAVIRRRRGRRVGPRSENFSEEVS